jgi:hypothetical protein
MTNTRRGGPVCPPRAAPETLSPPPNPPTLEHALRLTVGALHKSRATPWTHALAFEANIYEQHRPASAQMERAYTTHHQLRQAADMLAEQADDAQAARATERLHTVSGVALKVKP